MKVMAKARADILGEGEVVEFGSFKFLPQPLHPNIIPNTATISDHVPPRCVPPPQTFFLLVSYCVLPPVVTSLFRGLACTDMGGGLDIRMRAQPTEKCYGEFYDTFKLLDIIFLVIYMSIPLLYFVLLFRLRQNIMTQDAVSLELRHASRYDQKLRPIRFLIRAYKRDYYWMDVVDMLRRLTLVSALPVVQFRGGASTTSGEGAQCACGALVAFCFLLLYTNYRPYEKDVRLAQTDK